MSGGKAAAAGRVEEVRPREVGREVNVLARITIGAITDRRGDLSAVGAAIELRIGAGRLDDDDLRREAGAAKRAVLGPDAIDYALSIRGDRAMRHGQRDTTRKFNPRRAAIDARG